MTDFNRKADLPSLRAAIAASPILVVAAPPAPDFAAWCESQSADIDTVILGWLRSHAPQPSALS
jgi:hypothetical protein